MNILYTGFEPFGGATVNPSWEAVKLLPPKMGEATVIKLLLPVVYGKSGAILRDAVRRFAPSAVICTGLAAGRDDISLERVAINVDDASVPDNDGAVHGNIPILPDAPAAYFTRLPIYKIKGRLERHDIPCSVSNSAGTYVCNHVMYHLLDSGAYGGFIHVPDSAAMDVQKISGALFLCGKAALELSINDGRDSSFG